MAEDKSRGLFVGDDIKLTLKNSNGYLRIGCNTMEDYVSLRHDEVLEISIDDAGRVSGRRRPAKGVEKRITVS